MIEDSAGFIKIIIALILVIIFIIAILNILGVNAFGLIYKIMGKSQQTEKFLEAQDNITVSIKYKKIELNAPAVFENEIIISTIQPHRFKLIMHSKSSKIYFQGGTHELTQSVVGTSAIKIEIDATSGIITKQNVTVEVYLVDMDGNKKFLKNLTFTVEPTVDYFLRMYPSKDTSMLGYYEMNYGGYYQQSRIMNYVKMTDDVTIFSNIMLMYAESRLDFPFKVKFDIKVVKDSGNSLYNSMIYYTGTATTGQPELKVNTNSTQEFVYTVNFNRKKDWIMLLPYINTGYYNTTIKISVYLPGETQPIAEKTMRIRLISVPSQGYVMLKSIALTVPYGVDEMVFNMDWYSRLFSPDWNNVIKNMPVVRFVDTSDYMPMPDTQLTDRHPSGVYTYSAKMYNKFFILKFKSTDDAIYGALVIWSERDKNGVVNVYTLQYYYLSDKVLNIATRESKNAFGDLLKTIENLIGYGDFDTKQYFPLLYTNDVIVSLGFTPPQSYKKVDDYYAVCVLNYKGVPSSYLDAYISGTKSFLETETTCGKLFCHETYTDKFKEDNNCDCATKVHHVSRASRVEMNQFNPYIVEGFMNYESLSGFKVFKNPIDTLKDVWNEIVKLFTGDEKATLDDTLSQDSFVLMLLHPDKYKASKYLGVVHYYVVTYKVDGITYYVHVYSFMNMPLDKIRELAIEYYTQQVGG